MELADNDRVALVTGASSGIGAALVRELHRKGWRVGLLARREDLLRELCQELGQGAAFAPADVTDSQGLQAAMSHLEQELGACDLLVANAGIAIVTSARKFDIGAYKRLVRVNYEGAVNAMGAVLPGMLSRGRGRLAAISSLAAWRGMPNSGGYCASKAALSTLMETMRIELSSRGIGVSVVHPGFVDTRITQANKFHMPFLMSPQQAARRIVRGLEKGRAEINLPWQTVIMVRLLRAMPRGLYDRVMLSMGGH